MRWTVSYEEIATGKRTSINCDTSEMAYRVMALSGVSSAYHRFVIIRGNHV